MTMFQQMKRFFVDRHFETGSLLARLKINYALESSKWEIIELIFLICFITSLEQETSIFSELLCFEKSFPICLKISLSILIKTLEKMSIKEAYEFGTPDEGKNTKNSNRFSTGKRKRQDELIEELQEERNLNKNLRTRLKEKENEVLEIKNNLLTCESVEVKDDFRLYKKIESLEEIIEKNKEDLEDKGYKILELKNEIDKNNDSIDILKSENSRLINSLQKYQQLSKKFEKVSALEKDYESVKHKLKESYKDKENLLKELQSLRVNSKRVEYLENQMQDLKEEKNRVNKELNELRTHYEEVNNQKFQLVTQVPVFKEMSETSYFSQRPSLSSVENLMVEELEVKIAELTEENQKLSAKIGAYENSKAYYENLNSFGIAEETARLKYSKLECEYYDFKVNFFKVSQELTEKIKELEIELNSVKQERDCLGLACKEYLSKIENLEKNYLDQSDLIQNLRAENTKIREMLMKYQSSNELERMKNENVRLQKELAKIKSDLSENSQIIYTLKAENSHLYDIIESNRNDNNIVQATVTEVFQENNMPLSSIVSFIQILSLEKLFGMPDRDSHLAKYINELKCIDSEVTTKSKQKINELISDKNQMFIKLQNEIQKRTEAEKERVRLLKNLKQLEELQR